MRKTQELTRVGSTDRVTMADACSQTGLGSLSISFHNKAHQAKLDWLQTGVFYKWQSRTNVWMTQLLSTASVKPYQALAAANNRNNVLLNFYHLQNPILPAMSILKKKMRDVYVQYNCFFAMGCYQKRTIAFIKTYCRS